MQIKAAASAAVKSFFKTNMRQKLTLLSSGFIVYVVLLTGIFSYYHSEDVVTNRLDAKSGSVTVQEPAWDKDGKKMAEAFEPGMNIPKNPFGLNDGQVDEYIRLKMTVSLDPFVLKKENDGTVNSTYNNSFNDNTGKTTEQLDNSVASAREIASRRQRRLNSILNAIKVGEGDSAESLFKWTNTDSGISAWTLKSSDTNNSKFIMEQYTSASTDTSLVFYFYYTDGDTDNNMKLVRPGESTAELFDYLEIPIYKKDYLGVFDQGYTITIEAEAVPTAVCTDGAAYSAVKSQFDN